MNLVDPVRVLMYSHDTYGLGHLTRTVRIARALRHHHPQTSILILSGSPVAHYVALPAGTDLVKLPSVVKSGPGEYRARDLDINFAQIKRLRRDLILGTAEAFRPHLFMVDNVPLGMKGEVLPTLRALRLAHPKPKIILNLRDILDDPSVIREQWRRDGSDEAIRSQYDRIFVLGDSSVWDASAAYDLPEEKTTHVGYASPDPRRPLSRLRSASRSARILLTVGGGGDGSELLRAMMDGLEELGKSPLEDGDPGIRIEVVTGPLMDPEERRSLAVRCHRIHAGFHEFVPDLPQKIADADLTIAMAGYNTCCEILSHARAALVVPRVYPRVEQYIRARLFEERGVVRMIDPTNLQPSRVASTIRSVIERRERIDPSSLPAIDGLNRLAEILGQEAPCLRVRSDGSRARQTGGERSSDERRARIVAPTLPLPSLRKVVPFWTGSIHFPAGLRAR